MVMIEMWHAGGGEERCIKETSEGGRPFGRTRYIWKDIIKINLKEILRDVCDMD
jgi:hypothetical protein